jgi:hypothetical protein
MARECLASRLAFQLRGGEDVERQGGLEHDFLSQNVPKRIVLGCVSIPTKSSLVLGRTFLLLPCVSLRGRGELLIGLL